MKDFIEKFKKIFKETSGMPEQNIEQAPETEEKETKRTQNKVR